MIFFFFRENRVFVDWLSSGIDGQCFVDFLVFSPSINSFTSFFVFFFVFVFVFFFVSLVLMKLSLVRIE